MQDKPLADIVASVSGSVVFLRTEHATGSGFYINPGGEIVTARHVVTLEDGSTAKQIFIVSSFPASVINGNNKLKNGEMTIRAHVVAQDQEHDLALLEPESNPFLAASNSITFNGIPAFKVGHPATLCTRGIPLRSGDPIFTIGHPLDDPREVTTRGIVASSEALDFDSTGAPNLTYFVDMVMNPGNSGGPVFTSTGCVIGVADAVKLNRVSGEIPGSGLIPEIDLPVTEPDGKPRILTLKYSAGLGFLISQEYIIRMLDGAGLKSLKPPANGVH